MKWKDFLYFNKRQRRGVLVLLLFIFTIGFGIKVFKTVFKDTISCNDSSAIQTKYRAFEALKKEKPKTSSKKLRIKSTFDPNTSTESELIELGIPSKLVKNIVHYRDAGGKFYKKEDLKKLYAMTSAAYRLLKDSIVIKPRNSTATVNTRPRVHTNGQKIIHTTKYAIGTKLELNSADTTELKKVPGIGSYTARKIYRYRQQLGGFYSTNQLLDLELSPQIIAWFTLEGAEVKKLALNQSNFKALVRHPYLNYQQVKSIFNFKRKHGKIKSIKQLQLLEAFDANTIERLAPYLSFN